MSLELVLGLSSVLVGGGALIFAFLAWLNSRKSVKVAKRSLGTSEKQLRLARKQAQARPDLEVTAIRLLEPQEAEGVSKLLGEIEQERSREREWEEKSIQIERLPMAERLFEEDTLSREYSDVLASKNRYQGPLPDKVVRVDLANWGESAAFGVRGCIFFESSHLKPLDYFSDDAKVLDNQIGAYKVEVGNDKDILLTPTARCSFDIAVSIRSPGTTWVAYDLSCPTGSFTQNVNALELPDL
jgi:hypothetical protein